MPKLLNILTIKARMICASLDVAGVAKKMRHDSKENILSYLTVGLIKERLDEIKKYYEQQGVKANKQGK